jgi:hypothetical protein
VRIDRRMGGTIAAPIARDVITAYLGSSVAK